MRSHPGLAIKSFRWTGLALLGFLLKRFFDTFSANPSSELSVMFWTLWNVRSFMSSTCRFMIWWGGLPWTTLWWLSGIAHLKGLLPCIRYSSKPQRLMFSFWGKIYVEDSSVNSVSQWIFTQDLISLRHDLIVTQDMDFESKLVYMLTSSSFRIPVDTLGFNSKRGESLPSPPTPQRQGQNCNSNCLKILLVIRGVSRHHQKS